MAVDIRRLCACAVLPATNAFGDSAPLSASVAVAPEWKPANVRVVGFLQERESHRIVGAGAGRKASQSATR